MREPDDGCAYCNGPRLLAVCQSDDGDVMRRCTSCGVLAWDGGLASDASAYKVRKRESCKTLKEWLDEQGI